MELILDHARRLMEEHLSPSSICIDFTMGNGNDTLFLAKHAVNGMVYAFDIQPQALEQTKSRIEPQYRDRVMLILDSHSNFTQYVKTPYDVGIFNLGYLPGGDKTITTQTQTTLSAVNQAVYCLSESGILIIVLYPGHPAGKEESIMVEQFCSALDASQYDVTKYQFLNKKDPPYLIAIEHRHPTPKINDQNNSEI
jgi:tRNA1(Val) A37 N6-methylase TrmN6